MKLGILLGWNLSTSFEWAEVIYRRVMKERVQRKGRDSVGDISSREAFVRPHPEIVFADIQ